MKTYFYLSILNKIDCLTRLLHHWTLLPSLQLRPLQRWPWSCAHRRAWLWSENKDVNENTEHGDWTPSDSGWTGQRHRLAGACGRRRRTRSPGCRSRARGGRSPPSAGGSSARSASGRSPSSPPRSASGPGPRCPTLEGPAPWSGVDNV